MIRINLLPEELRPRAKKPAGWIAASALLLALAGLAAYGVHHQASVAIPRLENRHAALQREKETLAGTVAELNAVKARAVALTGGSNTVKTLYSRRIIWSKLLQEVKQIVAATQRNASPGEAIRLTRIAGYGRLLTLEGIAAAPSREKAEVLVSGLLGGIESYTPPAAEGMAGTPLRDFLSGGGPVLKRMEPAGAGEISFTVELSLQ